LRFDQLLDLEWRGAGALWHQLVDEGGFALPS
jgi:hypothetical protein